MNSASCSQVGCLGMFRVAIKVIEDLLCLNKTSSTAIVLFTCDFIASGVWNVGLLSGDLDSPVSLFPSWTNGCPNRHRPPEAIYATVAGRQREALKNLVAARKANKAIAAICENYVSQKKSGCDVKLG